MATSENQATKMAFREVEPDTRTSSHIRLRCHCGQVIKKRKDSFVPGLHMVICLACSNASSEVVLLDGSKRETTNADYKSVA